eukprot:CAMPEP_0118632428 /NCGR_PEP_ID=MMETSP0785-20121206/442_1 /TAXON_ID=91992 /ORGANISM="Bolidomonas pacifica, Strain CCMP 1866" /LENGTH=343 /DNA_ID=CAMNT_0006523203 /DNA_START=160 /DNA_END=1188 /DNA_ORIENTATION=+
MISYSIFNALMPLSVIWSLFSNAFNFVYTAVETPLPEQCPPLGTLAIVTGSNTGIGYTTALGLAQCGVKVIIACRSKEKGEKAAREINEATGGSGNAEFLEALDLSSLESVAKFAEAVRGKYEKVDLLVNNAGINTSGTSQDGLDLCFQTNFLGHYHLTRLLLPNLLKSSSPRVVNLSSVMHHFGNDYSSVEEWENVMAVGSDNSYANSKLASILFTIELNSRYSDVGLRSISVNPGAVNSDIWRSFNPTLRKYVLGPAFSAIYLDTTQGASCSLAASLSNDLNPETIYLQPYAFPRATIGTGGAGERSYDTTFPLFEMLGVYVGYSSTTPRLPTGGGKESAR